MSSLSAPSVPADALAAGRVDTAPAPASSRAGFGGLAQVCRPMSSVVGGLKGSGRHGHVVAVLPRSPAAGPDARPPRRSRAARSRFGLVAGDRRHDGVRRRHPGAPGADPPTRRSSPVSTSTRRIGTTRSDGSRGRRSTSRRPRTAHGPRSTLRWQRFATRTDQFGEHPTEAWPTAQAAPRWRPGSTTCSPTRSSLPTAPSARSPSPRPKPTPSSPSRQGSGRS